MHCQQLLIAYFSATAVALPTVLKDRQFSGLGSLGGLSGSTGTDSSALAIPTGLFSGLGSSGLSSGGLSGLGSSGLSSGGLSGLSGLGSSSLGSGSLAVRQTTDWGSLLGGTGTGSSTENGLDGDCKKVTLIFARGTTETGNMGSIVGPGLSSAVKTALNSEVAVQGVTYAADMAGIMEESNGAMGGTGGSGTTAMVADLEAALKKCPDTQIVLSGYSQGAMLVHNTLTSITATQAASVKVAITFGDPFDGEAPAKIDASAFKTYCATGDSVCMSGAATSPSTGGTTSTSTSGHLGYGTDVNAAAAFIKGKVSV